MKKERKNERNIEKNVKCVILFAVCFLFVNYMQVVNAKTEETITVKYYMMLLEKALEKDNTNVLQTATEIGLVKEKEVWDISKQITNEQAAILANRADVIKRKDNIYEKSIYDDVKYKKRISDMKEIDEKNREDVYQVFTKGIMVGESNGMYSQNRKFSGKKALSRKDAFAVVKGVEDNKKRKKISPDGQVIRTTNLPKNYKDHRYILESFPNAFYEKKFEFESNPKAYRKYLKDGTLSIQYYDMAAYSEHYDKNGKWVKVPLIEKECVDFARPLHFLEKPRAFEIMGEMYTGKPIQDMLDRELDIWTKKIETNLKLRLNVNYKTINNKWFSDLRQTYKVSVYDTELNKRISGYLKGYVNYVKTNKIIIESSKIVVEPSTLYNNRGSDYIRCYVKFKLKSVKNKKKAVEDGKYIFTTGVSNVKNIESGQWISMYVDIPLETAGDAEKSISEYSPFRN